MFRQFLLVNLKQYTVFYLFPASTESEQCPVLRREGNTFFIYNKYF
jgi:hypothetical protein